MVFTGVKDKIFSCHFNLIWQFHDRLHRKSTKQLKIIIIQNMFGSISKSKQSYEKSLVCSNLNSILSMNEWNKWRNKANVRTPLLFREESENVHGNMQMIDPMRFGCKIWFLGPRFLRFEILIFLILEIAPNSKIGPRFGFLIFLKTRK